MSIVVYLNNFLFNVASVRYYFRLHQVNRITGKQVKGIVMKFLV